MYQETLRFPSDMSSDTKNSDVWIVEDDCRNASIKYSAGTLSYRFRKTLFSDNKYALSLSLRFINASDQKVYVKDYANLQIASIWGMRSTAESIRDSLTNPWFIIPLEKNCIIIPCNIGSAFSICKIEIIMDLDGDSQSDDSSAIQQLTAEIESLKHAHADEVAALRSEIAALTEPASKKSKYTDFDIANAF